MADLKLLQTGAAELGIGLNRDQLAAFSTYLNELLRWNQRANLTAITAPDEIQTKHFLDSLTCLAAFPVAHLEASTPADLAERLGRGAGIRCLDVGTGAGFPGLPLKIALPEMQLTLIDSIGKKTAFLSSLVKLLKLADTEVVTTRAEYLGRIPAERESYDVVVARAVSKLSVVAELCLPLTKVGGRTIALKKGEMAQEMADGARAVELLGARYLEPVPVQLSLLEGNRELVVMEKVALTPPLYPRRTGIPGKRPLGKQGVAAG